MGSRLLGIGTDERIALGPGSLICSREHATPCYVRGVSSPEHRPTRTFRVPGPTDVYVRRAQPTAALGAMETEVLARIDGVMSLTEIAMGLGIGVREVAMVVARLSDLGAVEHELDAGWSGNAHEAETVPPRGDP